MGGATEMADATDGQTEGTVNAGRLLCAVLLLSQAFIVGVASAQSTPTVPPPSGWDPRFGPPPPGWDPQLWAAETARCQRVFEPLPADTSGMTPQDWAARNSQYEVCLHHAYAAEARLLAGSRPAATGTVAYPAIIFTPPPPTGGISDAGASFRGIPTLPTPVCSRRLRVDSGCFRALTPQRIGTTVVKSLTG
jgi:hypothetical protein